MTFVFLFLGFFSVLLLILYGLGIIRLIPKSLKAMEQQKTSPYKNTTKSSTPLRITAKIQGRVKRYDDATLIDRLDDILFTAGIRIPFDRFLAINIPIAGFLAFVLFKGASFSWPISVVISLLLWFMGVAFYLKRKQQKRRALFEKDFVDVIATIARAISVGTSLQDSFRVVCEEFPGPVRDEFNRMRQDILMGRTPQEAIKQAAARLQLQDFDFFALSVVTQIESGGNLGKSLDSLREMILGRQMILRQLKVKTASAKFQVRFFIGLPIVMGIVMYFVDPKNVMYFMNGEGKETGQLLVLWMVLGIILIHYMNKKALDG
jgi:Flp pilus assembly protein TadB